MAEVYDVIIIGAGMGGLMCGNFLAKGGKKVLIVEHNHQVGGLMAGFKRKGFYFDSGDQSIESGGIIFPLLKLLGLYNPDEWERARYRFILPGVDHIMNDFQGTAEAIAKLFPADAQGIRKFFDQLEKYSFYMQTLTEKARLPYTAEDWEQLEGLFWLGLLGVLNLSQSLELMRGKKDDLVKKYIKDPLAADFFCKLGYNNMSTMTGVGFWHMWINDYWYPKNGIQSLMESLADNFRRLGGEMRFKTRVDEILISEGRAMGVLTADGEILRSRKVVNTGDLVRLYTKMLPKKYSTPGFIQKITTAPVAEPLVALYLGLDMPVEELRKILKVHHTFFIPLEAGAKNIHDSEDPDLHLDTWMEINAPCLDNAALAPAGKSCLTVQTMTNYRWMDTWGTGGKDDSARTEHYARLKKKVTNDLLANLEKIIPGVQDKVDYCDLGTPLSTIRFTLNKEGGSCAYTFDPDKAPFAKQPLKFRTTVRGLYQAGQWSLWPGGVVGAAYSGRLVAAHILSGYYNNLTDMVYQKARGVF